MCTLFSVDTLDTQAVISHSCVEISSVPVHPQDGDSYYLLGDPPTEDTFVQVSWVGRVVWRLGVRCSLLAYWVAVWWSLPAYWVAVRWSLPAYWVAVRWSLSAYWVAVRWSLPHIG